MINHQILVTRRHTRLPIFQVCALAEISTRPLPYNPTPWVRATRLLHFQLYQTPRHHPPQLRRLVRGKVIASVIDATLLTTALARIHVLGVSVCLALAGRGVKGLIERFEL